MDSSPLVRAPTERTGTTDFGLDALFGNTKPTTKPPPAVVEKRTQRLREEKYKDLETEWPYRRFTQLDWPVWGNWLSERLSQRFPEIPANSWLGRLVPYMGSNSSFFVRNDHAVLLASAFPRVPDGKEVILEAFAVSRHACTQNDGSFIINYQSDDEIHLVTLYRHLREWGRRRRAFRLFIGQCSDMRPLRLKERLDGKECGWIGFVL